MDKKEIMSVWAAFQEVQEKKNKKLDPVGKEDGDVDNDGDEDSSDEYLANRRKKVGAAMKKEGKVPPQFAKKGEKDDDDEESDEKSEKPKKGKKSDDDKDEKEVSEGNAQCPKCEGKGTVNGKTCNHCDGKGFHPKESYGKKMKESNLFSADELAALEEKMKQPNDTGGKGEEFMSTSSPKEKKVMADHEAGSDKSLEDMEEKGELDAANAGKAVKSQSPVRRGESRKSEPMGKVKGS